MNILYKIQLTWIYLKDEICREPNIWDFTGATYELADDISGKHAFSKYFLFAAQFQTECFELLQVFNFVSENHDFTQCKFLYRSNLQKNRWVSIVRQRIRQHLPLLFSSAFFWNAIEKQDLESPKTLEQEFPWINFSSNL